MNLFIINYFNIFQYIKFLMKSRKYSLCFCHWLKKFDGFETPVTFRYRGMILIHHG